MEIAIIIVVAFGISLLTFFSGFGLGTVLTPVFALFFPIDISIALTGVVHFITNLVKAILTGRHASAHIVLLFGIPAVLASFIGAWLLLKIGDLRPLYEYHLATKVHTITPVKLLIAVLLLVFTLSEIIPLFSRLTVSRKMLPVGGLLSGFFGGLSGLQGAIRGAFLLKAGLSSEAYIATGAVIACMVDFTRLSIYTSRFINSGLADNIPLVLAASLSAIAGAFAGKKMIKKVTVGFVRKLVVIMLIVLSIALGTGIL